MRIGASDRSVSRFSGMVTVTELVDMIRPLDVVIGRINTAERVTSVGSAAAGQAGMRAVSWKEIWWAGRVCADARRAAAPSGGRVVLMTAARLVRRFPVRQWRAVGSGIGQVHGTMLGLLSAGAPPHCARS